MRQLPAHNTYREVDADFELFQGVNTAAILAHLPGTDVWSSTIVSGDSPGPAEHVCCYDLVYCLRPYVTGMTHSLFTTVAG